MNNKNFAVGVFVALALVGIIASRLLPLEKFPDIEFPGIGIGKLQGDAASDHSGEGETHLLADAVFRQHQGKQQIPRNTEAFGIRIMNRIEVAGNLFGKAAGLLWGDPDIVSIAGRLFFTYSRRCSV